MACLLSGCRSSCLPNREGSLLSHMFHSFCKSKLQLKNLFFSGNFYYHYPSENPCNTCWDPRLRVTLPICSYHASYSFSETSESEKEV